MYCEPLAPPARAGAGESVASTTTWREDCVLVVRICMRDLLWLAAVLLLFMYAVAAVSLFGLIINNGVLTEHANFSTWPLAMITLIRLATVAVRPQGR